MDHLWQEVQPYGLGGNTEAGFDMSIVAPVDSGHPTAEQLQQHQQMLQQGKMGKGAPVFVGECKCTACFIRFHTHPDLTSLPSRLNITY